MKKRRAGSTTMKFPQLAPGQRFRWQGAVYRKAGPMTAHAEADGALSMIPRSAVVEPLQDGGPAAPSTPDGPRRPEAVAAALDALIGHIGQVADGLAAADAARLRTALDEARLAFIDRVGL
jgi:hypothetical protein